MILAVLLLTVIALATVGYIAAAKAFLIGTFVLSGLLTIFLLAAFLVAFLDKD
jgi:hypothetical protein